MYARFSLDRICDRVDGAGSRLELPAPKVGYPGGARSLRIDRVAFDGAVPVITPTTSIEAL